MAGNTIGGKKAAQKIKKLHGENFYAQIGRKGGARGRKGGFAANPALAQIAGAKGGSRSKPTKWKPVTEEDVYRRIGGAKDLYTLGAESRAILRRTTLPPELIDLAEELYNGRRKELLEQLDKELAQI